jgi:5-methylcytosine-specific restriction endonuclease McrA
MDRDKAIRNRNKAQHLNEEWDVGAVQVRYREVGDWYSTLTRFPAALFDAYGYLFFATEEEYLSSPQLQIGKQIGIQKPGISVIPGYVRVIESDMASSLDVDIHSYTAIEGQRRLISHLQRERNQTLVRKKKAQAVSLDCEICGFSFRRIYGSFAGDYCEVHHLLPLAEVENTTQTRMEDLVILCANCHRVVHLHNPPYTLKEVQAMLIQ